MGKMTLSRTEVRNWIGDDPAREEFLIEEAPIAESTLKSFLAGRYIPGPRLAKLVLNVMQVHPQGVPVPGRAKVAG